MPTTREHNGRPTIAARFSALKGPEITLFAAAALMLLLGLNDPELSDHEEKVALPAHEAAANGHWLVPMFEGKPRLEKPPVPYWAVALTYLVTGSESRYTTRLPSALLGIVAIAVAYALGRKTRGRLGGMVFAACLAGTPFFMLYMHRAASDEYLAFFVMLALCLFYLYSESGGRAALFGFYAALAGAAMSKGPVALALVVPPAIIYLLISRKAALLKNYRHIVGAGIFFGLTLPWPVAVAMLQPEAFSTWLKEGLFRYGSALNTHSRPLHYYLRYLPLMAIPWAPFLIAGAATFRRWCPPRERGLYLCLLIWFLWGFIFFSICDEKKAPYLLPLVPAAALLPAGYCLRVLRHGNRGCGTAAAENPAEAGTGEDRPPTALLRILLMIMGVTYIALGLAVSAMALAGTKISSDISGGGWGWMTLLITGIIFGLWTFLSARSRRYASSFIALASASFVATLTGILIYN